MKLAIKNCLLEALRRYHSFHTNENPLEAWVGLGSMTSYKVAVQDGYMQPVYPITPRTVGWFKLTPKGLSAMLALANDGYRVKGYNVSKSQDIT